MVSDQLAVAWAGVFAIRLIVTFIHWLFTFLTDVIRDRAYTNQIAITNIITK